MSARELLELAATAAGIDGAFFPSDNPIHCGIYQSRGEYYWNPLISDSEAIRLSMKLGLAIIPYPIYGIEKHSVLVKRYDHANYFRSRNPLAFDGSSDKTIEVVEVYGEDQMAAVRLAIVRCAAEIGKAMP